MKHFVVLVNYLKPIEEINKLTPLHRNFLDEGYKKGILLMSGPRIPRDGGIIIARSNSKEELENFFKDDPYNLNSAAEYVFLEFNPLKRQNFIENWI